MQPLGTTGAGEPGGKDGGKDLQRASARGTAKASRGPGRRWQKMPGPSDTSSQCCRRSGGQGWQRPGLSTITFQVPGHTKAL